MEQQTNKNPRTWNKPQQGLFERPFSFKGRINRTEMWISWVITALAATFSEFLINSDTLGIAGLIIYFLVWINSILWHLDGVCKRSGNNESIR